MSAITAGDSTTERGASLADAEAAPTATPHAAFLATRHFASLDGVRALSCLAVIWHHSAWKMICDSTSTPPRLAGLGFLGVDMFFVLSGFLIVTLLLRERDRRGEISLKNFYARRSLRIFPIYYGLIFAVLAAYLLTKPSSEPARRLYDILPFLLTYTLNWTIPQRGNFEIAWTLAAEEQFYLVWPAVEKFLSRRAVWALLVAAIALNQAVNFGAFDPLFRRIYGEPRPLPILQGTFTPILLGVALAHLLHHRRGFAKLAAWLGWPAAPPVLAAAVVGVLVFGPADIGGLPRLAIQLLMAGLLGSLVVREDHPARPLLTWAPLAHLGAISYGMYWYHMWAIHPVRIAFARLGIGWPVLYFLASVAATSLVAELSYRFLEGPLLRLKGRFAR